MTAFVSLPELKAYLGNFVSNDPNEPEFDDESLQQKLDDQVVNIEAVWGTNFSGLTLPTPAGTVASGHTWLNLILEMLNLDTVVADILAIQAVRKFRLSKKQADIYQALAAWRWKYFETGALVNAILAVFDNGKVFDTTSFLAGNDRSLASQSPGLTITDYTNPSEDQITRFCLRESAFIRGVANIQGFVTDIADLNSSQLRPYKTILASLVAPQVARINLSYDPNATAMPDYVEKSLLDGNPANCYSATNLVKDLELGRKYYPIIPRA